MEVAEILKKAWDAVQKAGIPETLQEQAFKEAIAILRADKSLHETRKMEAGSKGGSKNKTAESTHRTPSEDEDSFFSQLAKESGVVESNLRDILHLTADGKVQVTPPTKNLGTNVAQQARTVIALVASARAIGLNEKPVNAEAVRAEADRKRCYQQNNFAHAHLGPMKGFNAGSDKAQLLVTSKWVDEFKAAVDQAHGRKATGNGN